jgi:hypothetical protein
MPSSPDSLTAVLQLLLDRGLSYAEIARLVSTDEATVRSRAVAAARALAPATAIPEERQGLIADYLLGHFLSRPRAPFAASWPSRPREPGLERCDPGSLL